MTEDYISREEAMERLGVTSEELDRLISQGRISAVQEGEEQKLSAGDVQKIVAERGETEPEEPELMLETEAEGTPEEEQEAVFDFAEELEVAPEETEGEQEEVVAIGAEDILDDILEEEESAEETVDISAPEEQTAEITQVEEEIYEGEDIEEVIAAEDELGAVEAEEEEFEMPYGAPVPVPTEAAVGTGTIVLLVLTIVVMAWAALLLSENILGTSSALTSWCVGLL